MTLSMKKLDALMLELDTLIEVESASGMDGGTFEWKVYLNNGLIKGFIYYLEPVEEEVQSMVKELEKLLRLDFFIQKHSRNS